MISGRETMTCIGNRACAMKSMAFLLVVPLNVDQSSFFNYTIWWFIQWKLCLFSVHVVDLKVREHLP